MEVGFEGCLDMLILCACCLFICTLKHTCTHGIVKLNDNFTSSVLGYSIERITSSCELFSDDKDV